MPLYVYRCAGCRHEFEEIVPYDRRDDERPCPKCKADSKRVEATTFGIASKVAAGETLTTPKEIDRAIGADADRRWEYLESRKGKRRAGLKPVPIEVPRGKDGTLRPMAALGDERSKGIRREFSEALSEHRAERKRKGLGQFDGPGAIEA